jgi:hypothetical protein
LSAIPHFSEFAKAQIDKELHVVFDPFPGQDELQSLLDELNAKRTPLPWLNNLVVQFSIAQDEPLHPLTEPEKRNRLFGDGEHQ